MAIAPALTALIVTVIAFALLPSVSVGGTAYDQISVGKEFEAEANFPKLNIIQIHANVVQFAIAGAASAPTTVYADRVTQLRTAYEAEYLRWDKQTPLTDHQARALLERSHQAAQTYFTLYDTRLRGQVLLKQTRDASNTLAYPMATALNEHEEAIAAAAARVQAEVKSRESDTLSRVREQGIGIVGITLLLMAASIALGVTVLRSITDRVRRLNEVATVELPQVLLEVQRAAAAGEEIPSMPPAPTEGGDELAAAATAFNDLVSTAVEMAAEQSRLRRSTSQMFINLGRRNHKLLSRTLTYITQLESDERDPATLQNLFRLDHLTTRMRRHAESLLVLAGSPPLRTWSRPVPIADVLRAALSEIETYDRVDLKELEPVEVRGASVSDLAHLVAELLENATAFSPPQTRVRVLGRTDSDGYTIVVVDEGIGMSPEELAAANSLIASTDQSSFLGDSRMLGLGVVGRLAARHGFRVNLTASPVGGVVAWVTLPSSALAPRRGAVESEGPGAAGQPVSGLDASSVAGLLAAPPEVPAPAPSPEPMSFGAANGRTAPALTPGNLPLRPAGPKESTDTEPADTEPADAESTDAESTDAESTVRKPTEKEPAEQAPSPAPATKGPREKDGDERTPEGWEPAAQTSGAAPAAGAPAAPATRERAAAGASGSFPLLPRAPEVSTGNGTGTGAIPLPPLPPASGPIMFRKPPARPGERNGLTRRIRGAQLPDTGEPPPNASGTGSSSRPERSAQSVRGALASFTAGRRTASEVTIGNAAELKRNESRLSTAPVAPAADPITQPVVPPAAASPAPDATALPRRVRGAQMPRTDLPKAAPAPERSAADVRAALSQFVAGRRAAEHDD
ncbi:MAG TPA: ATP-binding protein [Kineosporiaceae bacterium]